MKSPLHQKDFYKTDHRRQYPKGTTKVYSNFTARSDRLAKMSSQWDHKVVFFGLQYFIVDYLMREWNFNFFNRSKETACLIYKRRLDTTLGPDAVSKQKWVPEIQMGGAETSGNAADQLINLLTTNNARDLSLDMSMKGQKMSK